MSLFKWSTPQRRKVGQILPIIPNEIYIYIFECVAPPTGRLTDEQLNIFANLSRVCGFFANFCLPRIFEFMEFSGSIFRDDTPTESREEAIYKAPREAVLCTQIAAKQPLALSLAERVRVCHFTNWKLGCGTGSWRFTLFAKTYIEGISYMKSIRELTFSVSFVGAEHWRAIATLELLEDLSFDMCQFLQGPADVEPRQRVKVKVPRLRVTNCIDHRQPIAAVDPQSLRLLAMDSSFFDQVDWLPQSALTELHLFWRPFYPTQHRYLAHVHTVLMRAPPSVEALWFAVDARSELGQDTVRRIFDDPAWKNLPLLCSFTLQVHSRDPDKPADTICFVLDCIAHLVNLQSFTLIDCVIAPQISLAEVQRILDDKLGPPCHLNYADIYGRTLRLMDGKWTEVSCSTI